MNRSATLLAFTLDTAPEPDVFAYRQFHVWLDEILAVAEGEQTKDDGRPRGALLFLRGGGMVAVLEAHADVLATVRGNAADPASSYRPADYLRLRLLLAKVLWGDGATEGLFNLQTPEGIAEVVSKRIRTLEQVVAALRAVREVP